MSPWALLAIYWAVEFFEQGGALRTTEMGSFDHCTGKLSDTVATGTEAIDIVYTNAVAGIVQFPIGNYAIGWACLRVAGLPLVEIEIAL